MNTQGFWMHKDRNKVYLYRNVKPHQSNYSYRRGIKEFFITHNGRDIEKCKTMREVNEKLKRLREKKWDTEEQC